ncbi:hypothetical protein KK083_32050 [Fulvivirgaceae bacterium PWU4]|uniref:Uncharacterized protein n=1 Tax=Chryseosolibacter histidini TaxID=2782349 RepID=A0AAP2DSB1_9BACT|nr:hypothetical protein [Chryseosolibacter histidini]MBT1701570.1 hypothetical protein [Chryseosolibacter histidini]
MPGRFFLLFLVFLMGFDQPKLVKTKVADGITVSIPQGWRPMDGLDFTDRYPSVRAPLAAFTNEERLVDFSVNISATRWPDADIKLAQQFFKSSVQNMFDRVEFLSEGIQEVNGKKFIYFEIGSRINGKPGPQEGLKDPVLRYTYLQYLVEPGRTLVFSFNCPKRDQETWRPIAKDMMRSVKVK